MAHRPNQSLIIVVNADGGGYVKQFETLAEAKNAFRAIVTDGVAYLYQPATKSLSSKPIGSPAPISSTGEPQIVNGVEQKGMAFTVSELASGSPFQNPFDDPLVSTTSECQFTIGYDIDGNAFNGSYTNVNKKTFSSGRIDYQATGSGNSPCFYPNGYRIDYQSVPDGIKVETKTIYSLDYSGMLYGPYYSPTYIKRFPRIYTVANGSGGTTEVYETGVMRREDIDGRYQTTWVDYIVGDAPYKFNENISITNQIGHPIPNGRYLVTYKVEGDERIHSGAWVGRINDVETATVVWKFEPETPDQPPPPPCSITRKVADPVSGAVIDECDPDVVYPFSVYENCAEPIVVQIEGVTVTLGTNTKRGMDNGYGEVIWGECTGMVYVPNAQLVHDGLDYYYYSDGAGSYYSESKTSNCPASGTSIGRTTTDLTVSINAGTYTVGYQHEDTIADGNCGSSGVEISSEYVPSGTYLTEDSYYRYYSNGAGSYYTEDVNAVPPYGTELSSESGNYTTNVGCGDFTTGTYSSTTYADGMGGTYTSGGNNYYSYGTFIGNCNDYNYNADGNGGAYQAEYTGGGGSYPSYGTYLDGGSSPIYVNVGCSDWQVGTNDYTNYADGMGGSYSEGGNTYYPSNQYLGNCNDYNYYTDGNGGLYQGEYTGGGNTYPSYGTETGNGDTYPNYIDINGTQYENGTYSYTEYHDGNGGYYSESYTSYTSYGHYFGSQSYYDTETMTDVYTYYYSDGNGGYYTSY